MLQVRLKELGMLLGPTYTLSTVIYCRLTG